jgi:DNA-binding CsgD family transcriptional regulator
MVFAYTGSFICDCGAFMSSWEVLIKAKKEIRKMLSQRKPYSEIAKAFEVSKNVLTYFIHNKLEKLDDDKNKNFPVGKLLKALSRIDNPVKPQEFKEGQCKFLYGDKVPYKQCENKINNGSYCAEHSEKCYIGNGFTLTKDMINRYHL